MRRRITRGTNPRLVRFRGMTIDFVFNPELRLVDGTVIRNRDDALAFARAQEGRPGVDKRDEVLHGLERAKAPAEAKAAAARFRDWLAELEVLDERR
jgi:hypothetical protein